MKIPEYPEALQVGDDDYFIVETEAGTKKVKKGAFASGVTFDDEVSEDGVNAVRSKDIYKFVDKLTEADIVDIKSVFAL